MSDLTTFRNHCAAMATAEHRPTCRTWVSNRFGRWQHPAPTCPGCLTDADRALFAQLAAEVDDYREREEQADLFETEGDA